MKWIGQHIWDFVSRFRNDVYLETLTENFDEFTVVIGNDNKLYKSTAPSEKSRIQVRNDEGSTIPAGSPLYSKGEIGGSERIKVGICVSSDPAKMPCIGIAEFEMNTTDTKDSFAITQGVYNTSISGFTGLTEGDILYVNGGVAPHLTPTKPTNGSLIQNVGIVLKAGGGGTICQGLLVSAIGRTNDVPWPLYVDHATQRVGIGTTSPSSKLDVQGEIKSDKTANGVSFSSTGGGLTFTAFDVYTATNGGLLRLYNESTQTVNIDGRSSSGNTYFNNGGNVGIGTTSPTSKLHVIGDARIQGNLTVNGTYTQIDTDVNTTEQWLVTNDGTGPAAVINQLGTEDIFDVQDDGTSVFYIEDGGNIGIGTTSPDSKLHVYGTSNPVFKVEDDGGAWGFMQAAGSNQVYVGSGPSANLNIYAGLSSAVTILASNRNVGIGTTIPEAKLTIKSDPGNTNQPTRITNSSTDAHTGLFLNGTGNATGEKYGMQFGGYNEYSIGGIFGVLDSTGGSTSGDITIDFANGTSAGALIEKVRFTHEGNVGIGTTSPGYKLEVNGTGSFFGNIRSGGGTLWSDSNGGVQLGYNSSDATGYLTTYYDSTSVVIGAGISQKTGITINGQSASAGNQITFRVGNAERMRITDTGNIGIGTASPAAKLHIDVATEDNQPAFKVTKVSDNNENAIEIHHGTSSSNRGIADFTNSVGSVMFLRGDGNVGIGTTSPDFELDVAGNIGMDNKLYHNGDHNTYIGFEADDIKLRTGGIDVITANSSQNVGIGTTSPTHKLEVRGGDVHFENTSSSNTFLDVKGSSANGYIRAYSDSNSVWLYQGGSNSYLQAQSGSTLRLGSGTANVIITDTSGEVMRTSSGNVGIGTTSPDTFLHIKKPAGGGDYIHLESDGQRTFAISGDDQSTNKDFSIKDITAGTRPFLIAGLTGNVGINTQNNNPSEKLEVVGNIKVGDSDEVRFGADNDLRIYHNGTNSNIENFNGTLQIVQNADDGNITFRSDDGSGGTTEYFRLDGALGYTRFWEHARFEDNVELRVGTGNDLRFTHTGTGSYIDNYTGNLSIRNFADDSDILFQSDDGSGGIATYFYLDGSAGTVEIAKDTNVSGNVTATRLVSNIIREGNGNGHLVTTVTNASNTATVVGNTGTANTLTLGVKSAGVVTTQGNVGIGTDTPSEKLEVAGNIKVSGNLDIGGSVQKQIQVFPMNFVDDLGTDKHFMPFVTNTEQTVVYQEEAAMVMPADGRVVSVTVHYAQMDGADGNITVGIETSACGQSYANPWTVEETETIAASVADDHHVFHFAFDNAKHFESTDKMAISIQQSTDMQSAARFFWVTAVVEYDWSTFLGGTSAEYTTTP